MTGTSHRGRQHPHVGAPLGNRSFSKTPSTPPGMERAFFVCGHEGDVGSGNDGTPAKAGVVSRAGGCTRLPSRSRVPRPLMSERGHRVG